MFININVTHLFKPKLAGYNVYLATWGKKSDEYIAIAKKKNILGHSDIAPLRKKDPGEYFPWHFLYKKNIGIWHKYKKNKEDKFKILKSKILEKNFFLNLKKFGYSILFENFSEKKKLIKVLINKKYQLFLNYDNLYFSQELLV